jgi:4-hydroxyphenylacetate 3-monooxygenase
MRTGAEYLAGLDDARSVYVDGAQIEDVRNHPGFRGIAHTIAALYDASSDPGLELAGHSHELGGEINRAFGIPRSVDDLEDRRRVIEGWSRLTLGFVGRSPDHVAGFLAGFASAAELYQRPGRPFGDHVRAFYRKVSLEDLFVSYVIIPPQAVEAGSQEDEPQQVAVVGERDGGIVVRGAQVLGTCSAVSDYLFVSCIKPLAAHQEREALSFAIPLATPGLRLYARRPYASGQPSVWDYPLSTRFDETDALVVFDDVVVPWETVFVYREPEWAWQQFHRTPAHVLGNSQSQIRLVTKLKFLSGVGYRIAEANGILGMPSVQERLGELAALTGLFEGMAIAAENAAVIDERGVAVPNRRFLYGIMALQHELYPRVLTILRELAGQGLLLVPASCHDLANPVERDDFDRYVGSGTITGEARLKLFKLAWDAIGSEFGGRHHQYEMFYAGAPFISRANAFRNYDFSEATNLVDAFLASYGLNENTTDNAAHTGTAAHAK